MDASRLRINRELSGMIGMSIEIEGTAALDRTLIALDERLADLRPAAPGLAEGWYANVSRTIESGNGGTYPALSAAYARRKEKEYGGQPILVASGAMARSLTSSNGTDSVYVETAEELTLGVIGKTGVIAAAHQSGTNRMPRRPVYVVSEEFKARAAQRISADLSAYARSLGFAETINASI
jgi:phage gpG-like protein